MKNMAVVDSRTDLAGDGEPSPETRETQWSASRAQTRENEKELMATYFAAHEFLVPPGASNPEHTRESAASILVNQGTTPNQVVAATLDWIKNQSGHFFLTWYTPGHLVPNTLRDFRQKNSHLKAAAKLFLFPGDVDEETESVSGPDAENFAEHLERHFKYAILSAYAFDISSGDVYFHSPGELRLQRACATRFAQTKFLFIDSSKLKKEGDRGYGIRDLLQHADTVTIYTESRDQKSGKWIANAFQQLAKTVIDTSAADDTAGPDRKRLCLRIVCAEGDPVEDKVEGTLAPAARVARGRKK